MGRESRSRGFRLLTSLDIERSSRVTEKWRVVLKIEVECLRGDAPAVAIVSKQDSQWGAFGAGPQEAFAAAAAEGFTAYTEGLPSGEPRVKVN